MADDRDIAAYYDRGEEQGRLGDWGRLEFLRTRELLARFLPAPPATVLDVGGAAGAYALPLAAEGYEVRRDPAGFQVAVRKDWQRRGANDRQCSNSPSSDSRPSAWAAR